MPKILIILFTLMILPSVWAVDCLTKGTTPEETLKDTNFDNLQLLSMNIKNKMGGPEKGFYVEFTNNCKYDVSLALAFESWGSRKDLLSAAYYEPLLVQGWWNVKGTAKLKVFFERKVTQKLAFHARSTNGLIWGKETILYTVPGPDGGKAYPFIEYDSDKKCKADENNIVTCSISVSCN